MRIVGRLVAAFAVLCTAIATGSPASAIPYAIGGALETDDSTVEFSRDGGSPDTIVREVTYRGFQELHILGVDVDPLVRLAAPFSLDHDCADKVLTHDQTCSFTFTLDRASLTDLTPVDDVRVRLRWTTSPGSSLENGPIEWQVTVASSAFLYPNRISFTPSVIGVQPTSQFWVYNDGTSALDVSGATTSPDAPFTVGTCSLGPTLAPGQQCAIVLTWKPTVGGDEGPHAGAATVMVAGYAMRLFYSASFQTPLVLTPDQRQFSAVMHGDRMEVTGTIRNSLGTTTYGPFTATFGLRTRTDTWDGFGTDQPVVETNGCVNVSLAPGQSCTFTAVVVPLEPGYVSAYVDVSAFGFPVGTLSIWSFNRVTSPLRQVPEIVDFGAIPLTSTVVRHVQLTNIGRVPFGPITLHDDDTGHQDIVFGTGCDGLTLPPGAWCDLTLTATPTTVHTFSVFTSFPLHKTRYVHVGGYPQQAFEVMGSVAWPAGAYSVEPTTLDFGVTPLFGETTRTITFTNELNVTMFPDTFAVSDAGPYRLVGDGCTNEYLDPHESCELDVALKPTSPPASSSAPLPPVPLQLGHDDLEMPALGSIEALSISPNPLGLGSIGLYVESAPYDVVVRNESLKPMEVTTAGTPVSLVGAPPVDAPLGLTLVGSTCPGRTLQPNETCIVSVSARPLTPGPQTASATVRLAVRRDDGQIVDYDEPLVVQATSDPAPEDLTVKSVAATSASLTWTFQKQTKKWVLLDNGVSRTVTPTRRTNRYTVTVGSLGAGREHCFALKTSIASKTTSHATCLVTKPTSVRIRAAGHGNIVLTWKGSVPRYLVVFDDGHAIEPIVSVSRAGLSATISGLVKGARICIRLVAVAASASSALTAKVCAKVK